MRKKREITVDDQQIAERQIREHQKNIAYDTKDFTIELLVGKFNRGDFFVPDYQRAFIWSDQQKSMFLESVFLGLPIPFMFLADCADGRQEIIDGAQRMQTLVEFFNGYLTLVGLKNLSALNGFSFNDISDAQRRKFINKTLRIVVLEEDTPNDARQDLFYRINTTGEKANDSEIRRGSYPGPLTDFIETCSRSKDFVELCPLSEDKVKRHERFEFVLRYFAYLNDYELFGHDVADFLDNYLIQNLVNFDKERFLSDFDGMVAFVKAHFPNGFAKSANAKSTPRVRFEAIAVGVGLALRESPNLMVNSIEWLDSEEFKAVTTSDASNNEGKLKARVEFVRDHLLGRV